MKKIINIEKEFIFPSMIGEISSISLDEKIKFTSKNNASGNLVVSGSYKLTEASRMEEDFKYDIPVDISLVEDIDIETAKITISDFNYEIVDDEVLKCKIDLLIEGVELIKIEEDEELVRECDGDLNKDIDLKIEEEKEEIVEEKDESIKPSSVSSLFQAFENSEETFTTYSVYIMRKEDSLDKILDKYKITKEELSEYNDLSNIGIGTKIIIPASDE